jgi:large subunit ribosomal protein L18
VHLYAQIIDDAKQMTLVAVSEKESAVTGTKIEKAAALGKVLAEKAKQAQVTEVVFDKGSYKYHGRIKAFADGAREGGLSF